MQYTIRNIPPAVDHALRERAQREGKSLNEVAVAALARALGFDAQAVRVRSLAAYGGSWREDPEFDEAIADQDQIDEGLWR